MTELTAQGISILLKLRGIKISGLRKAMNGLSGYYQ